MIIEPNDTISEANNTNLTSDNPGSFFAEGFIGDSPNITQESDDVDLLRVQVDQGDRLTIDIDADINASSLDSILRLFDSQGNEVAVNDDFDSLDSFISFDASVSDTYFIGVSSFDNFDYDSTVAGSGSGFSLGEYDINITLLAALNGTEDADVLIGTSEAEIINGLGGNDTIGGADGNDIINGGEGNDFIDGGDDNDNLQGNSGDDILSGGRGTDFLSGGEGDDTLEGNPGNDDLVGDKGNDILRGGGGSDNLVGNGGRDSLFGEGGNDNLAGNGGNDILRGGTGSDTLEGGKGNDILQGEIGNDFLIGGAGADQFVLASGQGGETIQDFEDDIDRFVLGAGLNLENLDILSTGSDTAIINDDTILAVVKNTQPFVIGVEDFVF